MKTINNTYTHKNSVVTFSPKLCINSGNCCLGLPEVFKTSVIPWIDLEGANIELIASQIKKCPSGALQFKFQEELTTVK